MAGGEHEAVAVRPIRLGRGVAEEAGPERERHRRGAHRRTRMPGVRLLDAVDRERPDRVDGEAVEGGVGEGHEAADSEWAGPRGSAGSIGPGILTTPRQDVPPACRRTGRSGPRRESPRGAAEPGRRLPGPPRTRPSAAATASPIDAAVSDGIEVMFSCQVERSFGPNPFVTTRIPRWAMSSGGYEGCGDTISDSPTADSRSSDPYGSRSSLPSARIRMPRPRSTGGCGRPADTTSQSESPPRATHARSPSTTSGKALRGVSGRPYATIRRSRPRGASARNGRRRASIRGSNVNVSGKWTPSSSRNAASRLLFTTAIVGTSAVYSDRASSDWADHG